MALGSPAAIAAPTAEDVAAARALFQEGRKLMAAGKHAEACPKLEEAMRLDPGKGTQFNLADCYEHVGKTASAWALFLEVVAASRASGQAKHQQKAQERADAVAARVPRLRVELAPGVPSDATITRDGATVGRALIGTELPLDPGEHVFAATAPGRHPWSEKITLAPGESRKLVIPPLDAETPAVLVAPPPAGPAASSAPPPRAPTPPPPTASPAPPPAPASDAGSPRRTAGIVVGAVGVVGLGVATYFTLQSLSAKRDANDGHCEAGTTSCFDDEGVTLRDRAQRDGRYATVFGLGGLVATGMGAFLWLGATDGSRTSGLRVAPSFGPSSGGLVAGGSFR